MAISVSFGELFPRKNADRRIKKTALCKRRRIEQRRPRRKEKDGWAEAEERKGEEKILNLFEKNQNPVTIFQMIHPLQSVVVAIAIAA